MLKKNPPGSKPGRRPPLSTTGVIGATTTTHRSPGDSPVKYERSSDSKTVRSAKDGQSLKMDVPYPIFEFDFPVKIAHNNKLPVDSQFSDPIVDAFMCSEPGQTLRRNERIYNATLRQFIYRNSRITGVNLLFVGSGASKEIMSILRRMPQSVTFLDISSAALNRLRVAIDASGLSAPIDISYVASDATEWLHTTGQEKVFDVVIATKCIGQIMRRPGTSYEYLMLGISNVLKPNGYVYADHHDALISAPENTPIGSCVSPSDYDVATICGRYADDRAYYCFTPVPDFTIVAAFTAKTTPTRVQQWTSFCIRYLPSVRADQSLYMANTAYNPKPRGFPRPPALAYDEIAELLIPVNSRGVKRIPTPDDKLRYKLNAVFPKFDGTPGILLMHGNAAVFVSGTYRFEIAISYSVDTNLSMACELVESLEGLFYVVVTGIVEIGDNTTDPLDANTLRAVLPLLSPYAENGILVNTPDLVRNIRGDQVVLTDYRGSTMRLPVDGLHVAIDGKNGTFIKSLPFCTVDAAASEIKELLASAYKAADGVYNVPVVSGEVEGEDIWEYARAPSTDNWYPVRKRIDKRYSDPLGSVIHTVASSYAAGRLGAESTVEQLRQIITT
uniref:M.lini MldsB3 gene ORF1 and ORF2 n=1 Tax=Melampsora lini TaxID=5261 RepID=Q01203_MELLI|nr:unnamed protein product [Melampsora lini]